MDILNYQEAFGAADKTSSAMQKAIDAWLELYYRSESQDGEDPCQRIGYTVINKLVRTAFAEYKTSADDAFVKGVLTALEQKKELALQMAMLGGELLIKPWPTATGFAFSLIPRQQVLIFARDHTGAPTDIGTVEQSTLGNAYFTLLERRTVDSQGFLTVQNTLYRSYAAGTVGNPVPLSTHPLYEELEECYTYTQPVGSLGLVHMKTPMLNCVDGSADGVSVLAPVVGLIHSIDRNEYLLSREFENGQSRVFASSDLLRDGQLQDQLFVGLDDDPERIGVTVFSPQLRDKSFLNRKQEYLRNVESVIGLKRGLLSDANVEERTATEIASSQGEHALTVLDFQRMWEKAVYDAVSLCALLGQLYGIPGAKEASVQMDWGNGVLFDESQMWEDYKDMVARGMLRPEVALGWRFGMAADTPQQQKVIREKFLPEKN